MGSTGLGVVGLYYERARDELHSGNTFIRRTVNGTYHVLVQDKHNRKLCRIVAEVEREDLAHLLLQYLKR